MKDKGIVFKIVSEKDAEHFLKEHNYYVKLSSYRFNFPKNNKSKYIGLDFFHLKDLSTIDMHLKVLILETCLNIEHALKVNLLNDITTKNLGEFVIVEKYINNYPRVLDEIERHRNTSYTKYLLNKYPHPNYPIWVFLEVISFGELVNFYKFYCKEESYKLIDYRLLYNVRDIRNASAHSNCLIHNLGEKYNIPNENLRKSLLINLHIGKGSLNNKLKNKSIHDFSALIETLNIVVKSDEIKKHRLGEFIDFFDNRVLRNSNVYENNSLLVSSYDFIKKLLDSYSKLI